MILKKYYAMNNIYRKIELLPSELNHIIRTDFISIL